MAGSLAVCHFKDAMAKASKQPPCAVYRWAEQPAMHPMSEAWFMTYWTTMARPLTEAQAKKAFIEMERRRLLERV